MERRRQRRIQLAVARVRARVRRPRPGPGRGDRRDPDEASRRRLDRRRTSRRPTAASSAGAVRRALGRRDRRDLGLEDVGQDLAPERAGDPAAGRPDLGRARASRPRSSGRARRAGRTRRPRGPPGSGAADRGRASGRRTRRGPAGPGAGCARRSGTAGRAGRRCPAGTSAAASTRSPNVHARAPARRGTSAGCPAAESITDIRCQRPGTAWQKAWTRPCGSYERPVGRRRRRRPTSRATGPSCPGATTPTPTAFAAWSPPPATTGVPARSPVAAAAAAVTAPVTSGPSNVGGSHGRIDPQRGQRPRPTSRGRRGRTGSCPAPSALSMACSPVSRSRT